MAAFCSGDIPCCSSEFRLSHLNGLCISYKKVDTQKLRVGGESASICSHVIASKGPLYECFLQKVGKVKAGDADWWQSLELYVTNRQRRMQTGRLLDIDGATCDKLFDVFRRGCASSDLSESDSALLEKLIATTSRCIKDAGCSRASSYDRNEYESLGKIISFMSSLEIILHKVRKRSPPKEEAFIDLFLRFANMCRMNISPGTADTRTMTVLGTPVTSTPDLQYGMFGRQHENEFLVVTVDKFKQETGDGIPETESEPVDLGERKRKLDAEEKNEPSKKCKLDEEDDFGSELKGRHGAQLLLQLPYSTMKSFGNQEHVFGLVLQATKVRMTCLEMTSEHLRKIQTDDAVGPDESAVIHYTRAYNFLNGDDREELEGILLTLSHLANDYANF